jgi:hypothetical protein
MFDDIPDDPLKFTDEQGNELSLSDLLAAATQENNDRLASDTEWTQKNTYHIHTIIKAFCDGVLSSYPYYVGLHLPPNFELVVNKMSDLLHAELKKYMVGLECIEISILKMRGIYNRLAMSIPEYVDWNNIGDDRDGDGIQIVSRFDKTQTKPSFISLTVPPHNAALYLRQETRESKRFDEEFEKKYGKLE